MRVETKLSQQNAMIERSSSTTDKIVSLLTEWVNNVISISAELSYRL
jgi:hypothetical protein